MKNHFIKNIEIRDFKCFDNFKADGFARVNLIGGKNSVGKTALMEACLINTAAQNIKCFYTSLIAVKLMREAINNLETYSEERTYLLSLLELSKGVFISTNKSTCSFKVDDLDGIKKYYFKVDDKSKIININDFTPEPEDTENIVFINSSAQSDSILIKTYAYLQKIDKEEYLNKLLNKLNPKIDGFKVIKETPQCKVGDKYIDLTEMGDGVRHLISIVISLYATKNGYLFIDEIDNGIHYSMLDNIWEIILKVSEDLNVQVFATTHSKECIESYARIIKKLNEKEATYTILSMLKDGSIDAGVYNTEMLINTLEQNHEVRGW